MPISTTQIAADFTALCKAQQFDEAGEKYWAKDVVSLEPMKGAMQRVQGIDAVKAKGDQWSRAHEIHNIDVSDAQVNGDKFMLRFSMDVTNKESGQRIQMDENALYTVQEGKIVEERFFFNGPPVS
jgi:ketosteroid isomerase-like protein